MALNCPFLLPPADLRVLLLAGSVPRELHFPWGFPCTLGMFPCPGRNNIYLFPYSHPGMGGERGVPGMPPSFCLAWWRNKRLPFPSMKPLPCQPETQTPLLAVSSAPALQPCSVTGPSASSADRQTSQISSHLSPHINQARSNTS